MKPKYKEKPEASSLFIIHLEDQVSGLLHQGTFKWLELKAKQKEAFGVVVAACDSLTAPQQAARVP